MEENLEGNWSCAPSQAITPLSTTSAASSITSRLRAFGRGMSRSPTHTPSAVGTSGVACDTGIIIFPRSLMLDIEPQHCRLSVFRHDLQPLRSSVMPPRALSCVKLLHRDIGP